MNALAPSIGTGVLDLQQVPPQPVPGDLPVRPPPSPDPGAPPVTDPTQEPPPVEDPDVVDPTPLPSTPPMIARHHATTGT